MLNIIYTLISLSLCHFQIESTVIDYVCHYSTGAFIVSSLLGAYKFLLQILALFMAFHTRRIKVKGLNDSKEILAIVYINTIAMIVFVVMLALRGFHDISTAAAGLAVFIEATLFLALLFVPKVRN